MPFKVLVSAEHAAEPGARVLADNLADDDAHELAQRVHAATGEIVTLLPYLHEKGEWVLAEADAKLVGGAAMASESIEEPEPAAKPAAKKSKKATKKKPESRDRNAAHGRAPVPHLPPEARCTSST